MNPSVIIMRSIALLAAAIGCGSATAQQPPADLNVTTSKGITGDAQRPQASAFAVKDGKFVIVGEATEVARHRGPKSRVIDAKGHAVIPGLNDSHAHVIREGRLYNTELRWDG